MIAALRHMSHLFRAGRTFARHGILPEDFLADLPAPARLAYRMLALGGEGPAEDAAARSLRVTSALEALGPSHIKLGQFLATRPDLVGPEMATALAALQDRMPSFDQAEAEATIESQLGAPCRDLYASFGTSVAAASIAQVHYATVAGEAGEGETRESPVAVKILRPGIEKRFARDLDAFFFVARLAERFHKPTRRLRPVDAVDTLARSVELEMDLRMEAAALSEMAENIASDSGFRVPRVDWSRTARRVLTLEWIDGIPLNDVARLEAEGHDLKRLGRTVIQSFLRHAMRDGFFHADMHQGNLFVEPDGTLVAVDFGITGRLSHKDRRFLAEILHGFITRDYMRVAQVHYDAGYVPPHHPVSTFAQALRAIGEPLMDKDASEISMARLLGQLFHVTEQFDMVTQPQLLLLQKTMVVVEGVARTLDPVLNMWTTAEPVVEEWMRSRIGPEARIQDAAEGAAVLGRLVGGLPEFLAVAERAAQTLNEAAAGQGLRLDAETADAIGAAQARQNRPARAALWIGAAALVVIALAQVF